MRSLIAPLFALALIGCTSAISPSQTAESTETTRFVESLSLASLMYDCRAPDGWETLAARGQTFECDAYVFDSDRQIMRYIGAVDPANNTVLVVTNDQVGMETRWEAIDSIATMHRILRAEVPAYRQAAGQFNANHS